MDLFARVADGIDAAQARLGRVTSWMVLVMVLVGAFNAIARHAGRWIGVNLASNAWIELQWYLFGLVFLLGAGDVLRRDAHVRVDLLYGRLGTRGRAWIDLLGTALFLIPFCAFGIWVSSPSVRASWAVWEGSPDPGGLPRYPIRTAVLVSFGLLIAQGAAQLVRHGKIALARGERP